MLQLAEDALILAASESHDVIVTSY